MARKRICFQTFDTRTVVSLVCNLWKFNKAPLEVLTDAQFVAEELVGRKVSLENKRDFFKISNRVRVQIPQLACAEILEFVMSVKEHMAQATSVTEFRTWYEKLIEKLIPALGTVQDLIHVPVRRH